jgi:hypothetical protein
MIGSICGLSLGVSVGRPFGGHDVAVVPRMSCQQESKQILYSGIGQAAIARGIVGELLVRFWQFTVHHLGKG